jgi:hypothetical protein
MLCITDTYALDSNQLVSILSFVYVGKSARVGPVVVDRGLARAVQPELRWKLLAQSAQLDQQVYHHAMKAMGHRSKIEPLGTAGGGSDLLFFGNPSQATHVLGDSKDVLSFPVLHFLQRRCVIVQAIAQSIDDRV